MLVPSSSSSSNFLKACSAVGDAHDEEGLLLSARQRFVSADINGGAGLAKFKSSHTPVPISPSSFLSIPGGISPTEFLGSPVLLSPSFIMSSQDAESFPSQAFNWRNNNAHCKQETLEKVNSSHISFQTSMRTVSLQAPSFNPSSTGLTTSSEKEVIREQSKSNYSEILSTIQPSRHHTSKDIGTTSMEAQSLGDQRGTEDGYNWKKYGQKQVKGSENPRGYYKCTHPNCPTKKKVERSLYGQITEINYKGKHNHTKPKPSRRNTSCFDSDQVSLHSQGQEHSFGGLFGAAMDSTKTTKNSYASNSMRSNFHGDSFVEDEPDMKKLRNDCENEGIADIMHFRDTKVVIQTTSDIDILDDGYRWRKYGQKVVKGNPNPRSYYKCTTNSCLVRKHVERASTDLRAVLTTYEGKHNHDAPAHRASRCLMKENEMLLNNSTNNTLYNYMMPTRPLALATPEGQVATDSFFGSRPNVGIEGFGFSRVGSTYFYGNQHQ